MKQRLLVMNGQRILQGESDGAWTSQKVDKAGTLKPGIYNIYTAEPVDKSQRYDGVIVYADKNSVYQQIGKKFVMGSCGRTPKSVRSELCCLNVYKHCFRSHYTYINISIPKVRIQSGFRDS